jgi:hypothetical protein
VSCLVLTQSLADETHVTQTLMFRGKGSHYVEHYCLVPHPMAVLGRKRM